MAQVGLGPTFLHAQSSAASGRRVESLQEEDEFVSGQSPCPLPISPGTLRSPTPESLAAPLQQRPRSRWRGALAAVYWASPPGPDIANALARVEHPLFGRRPEPFPTRSAKPRARSVPAKPSVFRLGTTSNIFQSMPQGPAVQVTTGAIGFVLPSPFRRLAIVLARRLVTKITTRHRGLGPAPRHNQSSAPKD